MRFALVLGVWFAADASAIDLRNANVVVAVNAPSPERKAAAMLVDEIEKRTRIRLPVRNRWSGSTPAIALGQPQELQPELADHLPAVTPGAHGFRIESRGSAIVIA